MCILSYIYGSNSLELGEDIQLFYVVQDFCQVTVHFAIDIECFTDKMASKELVHQIEQFYTLDNSQDPVQLTELLPATEPVEPTVGKYHYG